MLTITFKLLACQYLVGVFVSNGLVAVLVAIVFFVLAFLILFHQKVTFGIWFQISDLHHETFALASVALGIGVLIGSTITETTRKKI
jgi:hypothetical protein